MHPPRARGVLAFVPVCILSLALGVASCSKEVDADAGGTSEPPPAQATESTWIGFEGQVEWQGQAVAVRLRPLMASPERRAFDSHAWGLEAGHVVWSLQLSVGEPTEGAPAPGLDLTGLAVLHAQGDPLRFLDGGEVPGTTGVHDPLRVLLGPPTGKLAAGARTSLALVGPAHLLEPKLSGLPFELALTPEQTETAGSQPVIPILDYTGQY